MLLSTVLGLMNTELENEFQNKFLCPTKFSQEIENLVSSNTEINYIEAIIIYCEENNIELETVPKLISKTLKEKLRYEASELNYLKKTSHAKLVF